jgi:hypothetical protein
LFLFSVKDEVLVEFVIPAKAGIQDALKTWILGRVPLARKEAIVHFSRLLQEAQIY